MSLRSVLTLLCAIAVVAIASVPSAHAQGGSGPLLSPPAETTSTDPPGDEESDESGLDSYMQILLLAGAIILIGGIAFVITRDARRSAPADSKRQMTDAEAGGSPAKAKQRARDRDKRRQKGKQARKQRKRNR